MIFLNFVSQFDNQPKFHSAACPFTSRQVNMLGIQKACHSDCSPSGPPSVCHSFSLDHSYQKLVYSIFFKELALDFDNQLYFQKYYSSFCFFKDRHSLPHCFFFLFIGIKIAILTIFHCTMQWGSQYIHHRVPSSPLPNFRTHQFALYLGSLSYSSHSTELSVSRFTFLISDISLCVSDVGLQFFFMVALFP